MDRCVCLSYRGLLRLHREMAVKYLQDRVTTAKKLGSHNYPPLEGGGGRYIYN